jgi:hypothetical protein
MIDGGPKPRFNRELDGDSAVDLFLDRAAIYGSERHPVLQAIIQQIESSRLQKREQIEALKAVRGTGTAKGSNAENGLVAQQQRGHATWSACSNGIGLTEVRLCKNIISNLNQQFLQLF